MNSRGTRIAHRITGDTLAISDSVAMTPTVQPAAAGTQRSREVDSLRGRDGSEGHRRRGYSVLLWNAYDPAGRKSLVSAVDAVRPRGGRRGDVSEQGVVTGRLTCATVSG